MVCSASIYKSTATACCGLLKFCAVKKGSFYMMGGGGERTTCLFICLLFPYMKMTGWIFIICTG